MGLLLWKAIYDGDKRSYHGIVKSQIILKVFASWREPFEPENQEELVRLLKEIKENYPKKKNIWCYTGYTYDKDLLEGGKVYTPFTEEMLSYIDTLVDGQFIESQKDITLKFRGSANQRNFRSE